MVLTGSFRSFFTDLGRSASLLRLTTGQMERSFHDGRADGHRFGVAATRLAASGSWQHQSTSHFPRRDSADAGPRSHARRRFEGGRLLMVLLLLAVRDGRCPSNDEEYASVANDDGQTRKDEGYDEEELFG